MQHAINVLQIFDEVPTEVSSENYVFLSKTVILDRLMIKKVKVYISQNYNNSEEIKKLGSELLKGLSERFGSISSNELITQATLLDPRFKKQSFSDDGAFKECYAAVVAQFKSLYSQQKHEDATIATHTAPSISTSSSSIWEEFDEATSKLQGSHDSRSTAIVELDKYLVKPYLSRHNDPLIWWQSRQ